MGIQINGQTDRISAVDGSFSIQDLAEVNVTGVATASNFKSGTSNVHSTGYECTNINATGIVTAASANFTGNVSVGGTLTYQDVTNIDSVGIITARSAIVLSDDNAIHFRGVVTDDADAILRASAGGGQLLINSRNDTIINIDSNNDSSDAHFAVAHGAATGSSTEVFRVQEDGKIGINETSPSHVLDVKSQAAGTYFINGQNHNGNNIFQVYESSDGDGNHGMIYLNNGSGTTLTKISTNGSSYFNGGNIGINETAPDRTLHVNSGATDTALKLESTDAEVSLELADNTGSSYIGGGGSYLNFYSGGNERLRIDSAGNVGINETSPDTNLHISRSASQDDTHGILKVESTSTGTGAATNAGIITKNRYGWSQFMQWEENGLRVGSRSTTTGGEGKVTVTYGADSTGAVINENGVVTMPQQCGFHVVLHTSQTLTNNAMVNLWDTDASDSRSYIKNMTFNAGRFVAPVSGLYYFTAQLLLSGVASSDDSIHIAWTTGSGNDTFAYWNTRHDGASANGSYGYGGYLPVTGSTTVYLAANGIFGIRANFTGGIGIHGTDANWGHWSGFLVG